MATRYSLNMTLWLFVIVGSVFAYVSVVFGVAWRKQRLDIVDIAWSGAFILTALISWFFGSKGLPQNIVTLLVVVWGVRLGLYILKRLRRSGSEDPRYHDIRKKWRYNVAVNAYVRIFLVQGLLALIISSSVVAVNLSSYSMPSIFTNVGLLVWIVGFLFELIGDAQLAKYLSNPKNKGKLMTDGLWKYTRHPNYFGEAMQWWGIFIVALGIPYGWITLVSPFLITFLLLFVSGIPLTEKRFQGRPGWSEYKKKTSMFLPLPPKQK